MTETSIDFASLHFKGRKFYFYCSWGKNEFDIQVTDGRSVWTGKATQNVINSTLCPKGMKASEYIELVRNVCTTL